MIRVGVDVRELGGRPTGVGRYLREVLVRWQDDPACRGAELMLFTPEARLADRWVPLGHRGATLTWQHVPGRGGAFWEQHHLAGAALRARLDVFFAPAYTAPLRLEPPSVVVMHDVSFAAHPEWFPWRHGLRMRKFARWSARRAHTVLTMSAFSKAEIQQFQGVPAEHIRVIPLAVDYHDARRPAGHDAPVARPSAGGGTGLPNTVLYVGSVFERRHLPLLIEGVALARRHVPDVRLVVIGENRTATRQDLRALARSRGMDEALHLHDYVTETALEAAYAEAGVFAFLSEYEGFGLTPLEAMRHRLPTIVLDTSVAREVYGNGARLVGLGDPQAVGDAITELLRDPDRRAAQIAAGDAAVGRYRWQQTARATWDAIVTAAGARR